MKYVEIAKAANVSVSTVSKVMSGSSAVHRETAELVLRIAAENNVKPPKYHKNDYSAKIAVIVPEVISATYSMMATSVIEELRLRGLESFLYPCGFTNERYFKILRMIETEQLADGILTFSRDVYPFDYSLPIVAPSYCDEQDKFDTVYCDINSGISDAVNYLLSIGHKDIGFISEKNTSRKLDYFLSAMEKAGLTISPKNIFVSKKRFDESGREAAEYFISMKNPPTALLVAYDEIAIGAIRTFLAKGCRVPEDISVIGINDVLDAATSIVPLTSLRTYNDSVAKKAVDWLLIRMKESKGSPVRQYKLPSELIIRASTAPPRPNRSIAKEGD